MLDIRTILVPTDFSDCGQSALEPATRIARLHNADLHLVHVQVPPLDRLEQPATPFPGEDEIRRALNDDEIGPPGGRSRVVRHVLRSRAEAPAILDLADEIGADLIIIGSHGRRGVRRWALGSTTEEVLRNANRAVLVLPPGDGGAFEPKRILVPVDFSEHTDRLVRHAVEFAPLYGSRIDLLHVVEMPRYPDFYMATLQLPENRRLALDRLRRIANDIPGTIETACEVADGRAAEEIADFAEDRGDDLILIGSHGNSGVQRMLLGSVAEGVTRRVHCPVLVLRISGPDLVAVPGGP